MNPAWLAWATYSVCLAAFFVSYGYIVWDAVATEEYLHVFTLTPMIPYLVAAGFAYRYRRRIATGGAVLACTLLAAVVGTPFFVWYYRPEVPTFTKAITIMFVPLAQGIFLGLACALIEVFLHRPHLPPVPPAPLDLPAETAEVRDRRAESIETADAALPS